MLLSADETLSSENPFNSYTKLQIILNKAKSPRNIEWCMFAMQLDWPKVFYYFINCCLRGNGLLLNAWIHPYLKVRWVAQWTSCCWHAYMERHQQCPQWQRHLWSNGWAAGSEGTLVWQARYDSWSNFFLIRLDIELGGLHRCFPMNPNDKWAQEVRLVTCTVDWNQECFQRPRIFQGVAWLSKKNPK